MVSKIIKSHCKIIFFLSYSETFSSGYAADGLSFSESSLSFAGFGCGFGSPGFQPGGFGCGPPWSSNLY